MSDKVVNAVTSQVTQVTINCECGRWFAINGCEFNTKRSCGCGNTYLVKQRIGL